MRLLTLRLAPARVPTSRRRYWWPQTVTAGVLIGLAFSLVERFSEGGQLPIATVAFTVLWCAGVCMAYGALATPLGLYTELLGGEGLVPQGPREHGGNA